MPFLIRKTITDTFLARSRDSASRIGFQFRNPDGSPKSWRLLTFREFYDETRLLSYGLAALGVRPADKVAILAQTRIEWAEIDMAILGARAITVPIYPSSTPDEIVRIVNHSESRVLVVDSAIQLEKIVRARDASPGCLPGLEKIVVMDPAAMSVAVNPGRNIKDVLTLQAMRELGRREETKSPHQFDDNLSAARPEDVFTICYTTGTTGEPKGVQLTHGNLMSVIEDCIQRMKGRIRSDREVILAILPFSHVLGRVQSMIFYSAGGKLVFGDGPDKIQANLLEVRPTLIFAVPKIFERAYVQIRSAVEAERKPKQKLFRRAIDMGRSYHEAFWNKKSPSLRLTAEYAIAKKLVFRRITERFGGRLRYAICGGAPLSRELGEFFEIAGIRILEGYGLTETCAPVTLNDPDRPRFGTVGKPLADVSIKIAEDGEILLQSKKVFRGYYKDQEQTDRSFEDGWFRTGDIGYLDRDGFLHITDRKKDLIVTSGGKNIAPQKIENLAKTHKPIREIVAYGDRHDYITALITLDPEAVIDYASQHQILFSDYAELIKNSKILLWVEKALDEVNIQLAGYERIRKFMILPRDFTIEGGELTASMKVRRNVIYQRYRDEFESLYR